MPKAESRPRRSHSRHQSGDAMVENVLVCPGCQDKMPETGWFQQQNDVLTIPCWSPEVQDQSASVVGFMRAVFLACTQLLCGIVALSSCDLSSFMHVDREPTAEKSGGEIRIRDLRLVIPQITKYQAIPFF